MQYFDINAPEIQAKLIAKNSLAFCFPTNIPIVPGHVLICPIRIVKCSEELTDEELLAIFKLKTQICRALKSVFQAEGFNFAWNGGSCAGQTVSHFHLHVVPRKPGDTGILEYDPRKFLYRPGSRAVSPDEELIQVAQDVREKMK